MNFNKQTKKVLTRLVPKGDTKESIKLFYYNLNRQKDIKFGLTKHDNKTIYRTAFKDIAMLSHQALYNITDDFYNYQHFYTTKPGDIIMDAGANVGHLSIFFAKNIVHKGIVYSFEPDKFNIEAMKRNISLNPEIENNIHINDYLLWNENKLIDFEEAGTVGSSAVSFSGKSVPVKKRAVTIDAWVKENNLDRLDFIKMDIEGAEIEAIEGAVDTIARFKPNFAIASYHYVNGEQTYIKVEEFFKKSIIHAKLCISKAQK